MTTIKTVTIPVQVPIDDDVIDGDLGGPEEPAGLVVFAHGSGSSRRSPRNRYVASQLQQAGFATLLIDLLTPREETIDQRTSELRFDIPLLAGRVATVVEWVPSVEHLRRLPMGLFGASTGAAAALMTAATHAASIRAVVSRGGRPDLAGEALARVGAPTLLIVGGNDPVVLQLNRDAIARMAGETKLQVIPGAGHLFEEPGTLDSAANAAIAWFDRYLRAA